jgi:hypothetical protein
VSGLKSLELLECQRVHPSELVELASGLLKPGLLLAAIKGLRFTAILGVWGNGEVWRIVLEKCLLGEPKLFLDPL